MIGIKALKNAVSETFETRKPPMPADSTVFGDEFLNDLLHQIRWKSFLKKKKVLFQVSMEDVMERIKAIRYLRYQTGVPGKGPYTKNRQSEFQIAGFHK